MAAKVSPAEVIAELNARKGNLRCSEVTKFLKSLGFEVKEGKSPGHKIFTHDKLNDFFSGSYNCGHGKNPEIKRAYIGKIVGILEYHQSTLEAELGGK